MPAARAGAGHEQRVVDFLERTFRDVIGACQPVDRGQLQVASSCLVRAFVPGDGIPEDPVTGSANAAIAAWMHASDVLPAPRFMSSQGREVGRDGIVEVAVDSEGEVWIGGQTQTVIAGVLYW